MGYSSQTDVLNRQDFEVSFTVEQDSNQTAQTLLTPTSGKSLQIKGVYINTEASSGDIRLYFATSANTVIKTYGATGPVTGYVPVFIQGQRNEPLKLTDTLGADQNYFILVNYKEV